MPDISQINFMEESTVRLIKSNVDDASVALAAWVSTYGGDAEERINNSERITGLINYLMRNKHETPFENAGSMTFYVQTPIFVQREAFRHRIGWSYNEMSGRYAEYQPNFYIPSFERPLQQIGKVGNYTFESGTIEQQDTVRKNYQTQSVSAWNSYLYMKNAGIANEVARGVLPTNLMTQYYCTCNPRSLMHFLSLRTADNALQEIQDVARKMETIFADAMPITYEAYKKWN